MNRSRRLRLISRYLNARSCAGASSGVGATLLPKEDAPSCAISGIDPLAMSTLFESASVGIFQAAPDGRVLSVNNAMARLLGFTSRDELLRTEDALAWTLFGGELTYAELVETLEQGPQENLVFEARRADGESFWAALAGHGLSGDTSRTVLYQGAVRDVTRQKALEEQLTRESYHDPLTGLVNRTMFLDLLDMALARARRRDSYTFALVSLDVDRFRFINETLGREGGDELLKCVSERLKEVLRTEDVCSRLGGDEFGLVLADVERSSDAVRVVERIETALTRPVVLKGQEFFVSVSAGIVLAGPQYVTPEGMLSDADSAMYRAQTSQEHSFAVFDETMQQEAIERLRVETDLRLALSREEFHLVYQPIVSLPDVSLVGFEALLRWERSGVGYIGPDVFVPLLEETRQIGSVGAWVLAEACRQCQQWRGEFPQHEKLLMHVNVSARQFEAGNLPDLVATTLAATALPAANLVVEVTESAVMQDADAATWTLNTLRAMGVHLAIDDFGTGYSSLAYLHRLPAQSLKIDKSFVFRMREEGEGLEVVRTIMALAQVLKKSVVAEGVETTRQLSQLSAMACGQAQGYYFAKPLSPSEAVQVLRNGIGKYA